ncbi:MAG: glycosyl hydrolase 53 family protein [Lachnospiraceae bacterium]|nr:glycosyl hydrolase 53 family protein [Lachnospiraceae bacterium]
MRRRSIKTAKRIGALLLAFILLQSSVFGGGNILVAMADETDPGLVLDFGEINLSGTDGDLTGSDDDLKGSDDDLKGGDDDLKGSDDDLKGEDDDPKGEDDDPEGDEEELDDLLGLGLLPISRSGGIIATRSGVNLVVNPGFEEQLDSWAWPPMGWEKNTVCPNGNTLSDNDLWLTDQNQNTGGRSISWDNDWDNAPTGINSGINQDIADVEPGYYRAGVFITAGGPDAPNRARITLTVSGSTLDQTYSTYAEPDSWGWHEIYIEDILVESQGTVNLSLHIDTSIAAGSGLGFNAIDDFSFIFTDDYIPPTGPVDKDLLAAYILEAEALEETDYTADSWEDLEEALEEAILVNDDGDATQLAVDEAATALREAIDDLVLENALAPVITTDSLPAGTRGKAYKTTLSVTSTEDVLWSLRSGNLPPGLRLHAGTGVINGVIRTFTPNSSYTFTVRATNESGGYDDKELSIAISGQQNYAFNGGPTGTEFTYQDVHVPLVNNLSPDFYLGADIGSFPSLWDAGVVYRNRDGNQMSNEQEFYDLLADAGMNYVRIRVFNDPYYGHPITAANRSTQAPGCICEPGFAGDKRPLVKGQPKAGDCTVAVHVNCAGGTIDNTHRTTCRADHAPATVPTDNAFSPYPGRINHATMNTVALALSDFGKGYGGGNNDLATAIRIGTGATNAGMKSLMCYHMSDFWADPGGNRTPKAWRGLSASQRNDAIFNWVYDSLKETLESGVDVGMVQIGNESNNGIAGQSHNDAGHDLYAHGLAAVDQLVWNYKNNPAYDPENLAYFKEHGNLDSFHIKKAVHRDQPNTNFVQGIQNRLGAFNGNLPRPLLGRTAGQSLPENERVCFEIVMGSWYDFPSWRGESYWNGINNVVNDTNATARNNARYWPKQVINVETSAPYIARSGNGFETIYAEAPGLTGGGTPSIQTQASDVRNTVSRTHGLPTAPANTKGGHMQSGDRAGIGVFYWEPAWLPLDQHLIPHEPEIGWAPGVKGVLEAAWSGNVFTPSDVYLRLYDKWNETGAGWASRYASYYGRNATGTGGNWDEGRYHGGAPKDNMAFFDFWGYPLPSLDTWTHVRPASGGNSLALAIDIVTNRNLSLMIGNSLPAQVNVRYNDGTSGNIAVVWNAADTAALNAVGTYPVRGTMTPAGGAQEFTFTVDVAEVTGEPGPNLVTNGHFNNNVDGWTFSVSGGNGFQRANNEGRPDGATVASLEKRFAGSGWMRQTINNVAPGYYEFSMWFMGSNAATISLIVNGTTLNLSNTGTVLGPVNQPATSWGSSNYAQHRAGNILVEAQGNVTIEIAMNNGEWGRIDDIVFRQMGAGTETKKAAPPLNYLAGDGYIYGLAGDQINDAVEIAFSHAGTSNLDVLPAAPITYQIVDASGDSIVGVPGGWAIGAVEGTTTVRATKPGGTLYTGASTAERTFTVVHMASVTTIDEIHADDISIPDKYENGVNAVVEFNLSEKSGFDPADLADLEIASYTAVFENATVGNGKTVNISNIVLGGTAAPKYSLADNTATATGNILARIPVTVVAGDITVTPKVFDDNTTNAVISISLSEDSGIETADLGKVDATAGAANFESGTVGNGKTVNITGLSLSGEMAHKYRLTSTTATATGHITVGNFVLNPSFERGRANWTVAPNQTTTFNMNVPVQNAGQTENARTGISCVHWGNAAGAASGNGMVTQVIENVPAGRYRASFFATGGTTSNRLTLSVTGDYVTGSPLQQQVNQPDWGSEVEGVIADIIVTETSNVTIRVHVNVANGWGSFDDVSFIQLESFVDDRIEITIHEDDMEGKNKPYDGNRTAEVVFTLTENSGIEASDVGNVTVASYTALFADSDVGTGKTITVTDIVLGGTLDYKYKLAAGPVTTTADIEALSLDVPIVAAIGPQVYGVDPILLELEPGTGGDPDELVFNVRSGDPATTAKVGTDWYLTITGIGEISLTATDDEGTSPAVIIEVSPKPITIVPADIIIEDRLENDSDVANVSFNLSEASGFLAADLGGRVTANLNQGSAAWNLNLPDNTGQAAKLLAWGEAKFSQKTVGSGLTVNVTGITLGGTLREKYVLQSTTAVTTGNIIANPRVENYPIHIRKVEGLRPDFMMGADISTEPALRAASLYQGGTAGVRDFNITWRDRNGNPGDLYEILADHGVNYVRARIWHGPYNPSTWTANNTTYGHGYGPGVFGAGQSDVDKAIEMGIRVTDAGMKLLANFHYSDFWADPARFFVPNAWRGMNQASLLNALYNYTFESLEKMILAGVDVGMVQVGNETNPGMAGVSTGPNMFNLIRRGLEAVDDINEKYGLNIIKAVHFTDPHVLEAQQIRAQGLKDVGADYDIYMVSWYPYLHGTPELLTENLTQISQQFDVDVGVVEVSYGQVNDGYGLQDNTRPFWPGNAQGQASVVADAIRAVANVPDQRGRGVFYWEPAWPNTNAGNTTDTNYILDRFGTGWIAPGTQGTDNERSGTTRGNSSRDDSQMFNRSANDRRPLASLDVWRLVHSGAASAEAVVFRAEYPVRVESKVGEPIENDLPDKVMTVYTDGARIMEDVAWNQDDIDIINDGGSNPAGYPVRGTVSLSYLGGTTRNITGTAVRMHDNLLIDPSFENHTTASPTWSSGGSGSGVSMGAVGDIPGSSSNARSGDRSLHFGDGAGGRWVEQTVNVTRAGYYSLSLWLQGNIDGRFSISITGANTIEAGTDGSSRTMEITNQNGGGTWGTFTQRSINNIFIARPGNVTIRITKTGTGWAAADDAFFSMVDDFTKRAPRPVTFNNRSIAINDTNVTLEATTPSLVLGTMNYEVVSGNSITVDDDGAVTILRTGQTTVRATFDSNDLYSSDATATAVITVTAPTLAGTASISGVNKIGETLTADTSLVTGGYGDYIYEWKADGVIVHTGVGIANNTYTIARADAGKTITVEISREYMGYPTEGTERIATLAGGVVPYNIFIELLGDDGLDSAVLDADIGRDGDTVGIDFNLDNLLLINSIAFNRGITGGTDVPGTGSTTYTVDEDHASNGHIYITVTFYHGNKLQPGVSFAITDTDVTYGDSKFTETALTVPSTVGVKYSTVNSDVAIVDEDSGEVTIVGAGTTLVIATTVEDADYGIAQASYTLNVDPRSLTVDVASSYNPAPVAGDGTITLTLGSPALIGTPNAVDGIVGTDDVELLTPLPTGFILGATSDEHVYLSEDYELDGADKDNYQLVQPTIANVDATVITTLGGTVEITGSNNFIGTVLSVDVTGVTGATTGFIYQWRADGANISTADGGNGATYTIKGKDAGKVISVSVSHGAVTGGPLNDSFGVVPYDIAVVNVDNVTGDTAVSAAPLRGVVDDVIDLGFTLANVPYSVSNGITFVPNTITAVTAIGAGTREYTVRALDAEANGVITITATFIRVMGVDKSSLDAKIKEAEALLPKSSLYTVPTWTVFLGALSEAQIVFDKTDATTSEVDTALYALDEAIKDLVLKPVEKPENPGGQSGGQASSGVTVSQPAATRPYYGRTLRGVASWNSLNSNINKAINESLASANAVTNAAGSGFDLVVATGKDIVVPYETLEILSGTQGSLMFNTGAGVTFSISGGNIPAGINVTEIDLTLREGKLNAPASKMAEVTALSVAVIEIPMLSRESYGMMVGQHFNVGADNAGKSANLYRFNEATGEFVYLGSYVINERGQAMFGISGGADYILTVTNERPNLPAVSSAPSFVGGAGTYIVRPGDNLWLIARRNGMPLSQLLALNPGITRPNFIRPGQVIRIR